MIVRDACLHDTKERLLDRAGVIQSKLDHERQHLSQNQHQEEDEHEPIEKSEEHEKKLDHKMSGLHHSVRVSSYHI